MDINKRYVRVQPLPPPNFILSAFEGMYVKTALFVNLCVCPRIEKKREKRKGSKFISGHGRAAVYPKLRRISAWSTKAMDEQTFVEGWVDPRTELSI